VLVLQATNAGARRPGYEAKLYVSLVAKIIWASLLSSMQLVSNPKDNHPVFSLDNHSRTADKTTTFTLMVFEKQNKTE